MPSSAADCKIPGRVDDQRPVMLQELNHDILTHIISFLDAPSLVCLALTCHQQYDTVLSVCRRSKLEDICPRDVGKPPPRVINAQPYNILAVDDTEGDPKPTSETADRWTIDNFQYAEIPKTILHFSGYRPEEKPMMAKHLAYIRHVEWHQLEANDQPSRQAQLSVVQGVYPRAQISFDTALSRAYLRTTFDFTQRFDDVAREFILMLDLWNQECIESVEFMVLRERLGDSWIKTKKPTSTLRLKQRKMRRERALRRFIHLTSTFHMPAPRPPGKLRQIVRKVSRELGYHGHIYSGLIWIEEHFRSILHL
ncbi:hypothetical protein PV04_02711 [Phialophora macrospora]|uniref:F-box domain-containing protein n=1 Tax=Phialophora macrospora TaxID=1851006 RepID=A0A0D2E810_9EURO|nr:hypothetical protein PV04_02711 [Phialophora macrospora]